MAKEKKNKFSIGRMIVQEARKRTEEKIMNIESRGRTISEQQRRNIYKKEKSKVRKSYMFRGVLAALGLTALVVSGTKLIGNGANPHPVEISTENEHTTIKEQTPEAFRETLSVPVTPEVNEEEFVIDSIVDSYNEQYHTNISSDNLKYLKSTNSTYLFKNDDGDYLFYFPKYNDNRSPENDIYSSTIYSLVDPESNNIFFSVGEITHKQNNLSTDTEYKIIDLKNVITGDKEFVNMNKQQGDYLHSSDIYLDNDLQGNKTIEERCFEACKYGFEKYIEKKNENSKNYKKSDELDK